MPLGVYTKYARVVAGTKYGRGDEKSKTSILEPVTECICYELAKLMKIDCAEYTLEDDYEVVVSKYSKYLSKKRVEFILKLLKERIEVVKKCSFLNGPVNNFV